MDYIFFGKALQFACANTSLQNSYIRFSIFESKKKDNCQQLRQLQNKLRGLIFWIASKYLVTQICFIIEVRNLLIFFIIISISLL